MWYIHESQRSQQQRENWIIQTILREAWKNRLRLAVHSLKLNVSLLHKVSQYISQG